MSLGASVAPTKDGPVGFIFPDVWIRKWADMPRIVEYIYAGFAMGTLYGEIG